MNKGFSPDEKQLITRLKRSDRIAYKLIFLSYYDDLCLYLLNFTPNKHQAEDIAQDILLKLWTDRANLKIHSSLKSYLFKSAHNRFIDAYRKKSRQNEKLENIRITKLNDMLENNDELIENRLSRLNLAIEELPAKCKEIFILSKKEGLKYKEIAAKLGISIKTVENQIGKAFSRLKDKLFDSK